MAKFFDTLQPHHRDFIAKQHMFFTASAPLSGAGHVNLSPKGLDAFRVLSATRVGYMDVISSGNETSAHVRENGRLTIMFCSFDKVPNILRLYGRGTTVLPGTSAWEAYAPHFTILPSTRQLIVLDVSLVQTSCGYGVPKFTYAGERDQHFKWAEHLGPDGLEDYVIEKNLKSLDGLVTELGARRG